MSLRLASESGMVNVVVAYAAEARPLVQHFELAAAGDRGGFRLYTNASIQLAVCGVGKAAASAAAAYLFGRSGSAVDAAWLNVGIGGHRELPLGSVRVAHRVQDRVTGKRWYPQPTFHIECGTCDVVTVDVPETTYPEDAIYEMEASAFYETCMRFASAELVHVVKVVSDNLAVPLHEVTPQDAEHHVFAALPVVTAVVRELAELAALRQRLSTDPPELAAFQERWHFTVTQTVQLRDALRRWSLVLPGQSALGAAEPARTSRQALQQLVGRLESSPTQLGAPGPEAST